ncbi:hypothetical protein [Streptomyces glaucescens]|uniref:hypothetical protein n=1 Tax=Streptomyces glaucescens TaxID=1907 RepID=UPI003F559755
MREDGKIRVFPLDDHDVVRRDTHETPSGADGAGAVGEAGTAAGAPVRFSATRPDAPGSTRRPDGSGARTRRAAAGATVRAGTAGTRTNARIGQNRNDGFRT